MMHFTHGVKGIVEETLRNGGGTWSISVNTHGRIMATANPHATGFYVARTETETRGDGVTDLSLGGYIKAYLKELTGSPRLYLGTWVNDGVTYLELSEHFGGKIEAIEAGFQRNQVAIWDISNQQEIRLKKSA